MKEVWKPIKNYEGLYEVSNFGRVKSLRKNKLLKPTPNSRNYLGVRLCNGKGKTHNVHRLVAEAFCEKAEGKNVVDHIDGNQHNNRANNLRFVTQKENVHFGRVVVKPVIRSDGKYYESVRATAADGFSFTGVSECCQGKRKTAGGYTWRYADIGQATSA